MRLNNLCTLFLALMITPALARALSVPPSMRVCVFYDGFPASRSGNSHLHAIMLKNLLGHFQEVETHLVDIKGYRKGALQRCDSAAYAGSDFTTTLPEDFLRDAAVYRRSFLWMNYGIWQMQNHMGTESFKNKTGFKFMGLRGTDSSVPGKIPNFFRFFDYKGQRFVKFADLRKEDGTLIAAAEIAVTEVNSAKVLAQAVHSGTGEKVPYVTEKNGFFYVADNPFLFIHPQDRYLILADVLFDFLRLPPRGEGYAFVRLEDVHPKYDLSLLYGAVSVLKKHKIPFGISVIPKFVAKGSPESEGIEITRRRSLIRALHYAEDSGGELLLHGYTHDVADNRECPALGSAAGYEFWDRCTNQALTYDSKDFARQRIVKAKNIMAQAGLEILAWVTPHYSASAENFRLFGRYFDRVLQRVSYTVIPPDQNAKPIHVTQFFPYTIYKDHYGQFVWPENLGFIPMPGSEWGYETPRNIMDSVRLNSVVRDSWASFFWHPQLLAQSGEKERLENIIETIKLYGYQFVSLKELRQKEKKAVVPGRRYQTSLNVQ